MGLGFWDWWCGGGITRWQHKHRAPRILSSRFVVLNLGEKTGVKIFTKETPRLDHPTLVYPAKEDSSSNPKKQNDSQSSSAGVEGIGK